MAGSADPTNSPHPSSPWGHLSAGAECVISFLADISCAVRRRSGNRRCGGAILAPAELATVDPHPVHNHGQAPGDGDDCSTYPAPLSHRMPHAFSHDHLLPWV